MILPRLAMRSLLAALAVFALLPLTASAQTNAIREAERLGDRLETSTSPSNGSVEWGVALAVVDAPTDVVMRIVTDYARYQEFLPHFRRSRVLSRRGNNALVYMQASVIRNTTTLWAQMRVYQRRPRGQTQIVEGRMTEGNMDQFAARWEVTPLDGGQRTLVRFRIIVDPDLPFPSSVFTNENIKAARKTLQALRERVAEPRYAVARNP
jgi:ribosome-associated toxin RatA of RatAB toxin-antitoxin module